MFLNDVMPVPMLAKPLLVQQSPYVWPVPQLNLSPAAQAGGTLPVQYTGPAASSDWAAQLQAKLPAPLSSIPLPVLGIGAALILYLVLKN
jgi:hypothetical protein